MIHQYNSGNLILMLSKHGTFIKIKWSPKLLY